MSLQLINTATIDPVVTTVANTIQIDWESNTNGAVALKNVLHVINGEHFSGAERVQQLLGRGLGDENFSAHFACLKPGKFASHANLPSEIVHSITMSGRFDRTVHARLEQLVDREQIELLHAHTPRTAMVTSAVAKRCRLPWVYHVHSPTVRDSTRRCLNWINGWIERRSLKNCDAVATVSESLRDEMLARGVRGDKIYVVPNGVETNLPISTKERLHQTKWTFGVVALFRPRKGLELLLEAFERFCDGVDNSDDYELEVIGGFESESYEQSIRTQWSGLASRDRVHFRGFVNDAPQRMRDLDVLVLPSTFGEGMPMVVLEAMASGIPVVGTEVEGTPEVIRDGVEGWLAKPSDVHSLMLGLKRATSSRVLWSQASAAAFKRQRDRYSTQAMCANVASVYRAVLSAIR
jgi:glycosyltransferase involved in cell wall biosynthesis